MSSFISQCIHHARISNRCTCLLRAGGGAGTSLGGTTTSGSGAAAGGGTAALFHSSVTSSYKASRGKLSSSSNLRRPKNDNARPYNTPTHMHLARSAEVVYTSKRDRLADPLVDPDDPSRAMGWNLQKRHKQLKEEREHVRRVMQREREDADRERQGETRRPKAAGTTFPPRPPTPRIPVGVAADRATVGAPRGDGRGHGRGGASASRNPGLAPVRAVERPDGRRTQSASSSQGFARDEAPHVGRRLRHDRGNRTVRKWDGDEFGGEEPPPRSGDELRLDCANGKGNASDSGKGRTISFVSSIAPERVFTAADADAGVNVYDLAAEDATRAAAALVAAARLQNAPRRPYRENMDGYEDEEVDMDVEMDGEREEEAFEYYDDGEGKAEFFYPPGEVSNVKGAKAGAKDAASAPEEVTQTAIATRFDSPPLIPGFVSALEEMFGRGARPTPVQGLSLGWVVTWVAKQAQGTSGKKVKELEVVGEESGGKTGEDGPATDVQAQSEPEAQQQWKAPAPPSGWREFLLAAETGSGKSIAYLLPMLQALKQSESSFVPYAPPKGSGYKKKEYSPRGVVLAPTHELARQLAGFAKDLCHFPDTKLKVVCASRANVASTVGAGPAMTMAQWRESRRRESARKMKMMDGVLFDNDGADAEGAQEGGTRSRVRMEHGADVIVGTPMKLLEMVRGRGWDKITEQHQQQLALQDEAARQSQLDDEDEGGMPRQLRRGRDKIPHFGTWRPKSEMGLENVEWVVVDEADVLFDPDFQETTRQFLADVSTARGYPVPFSPLLLPAPSSSAPQSTSTASTTSLAPIKYPFNLLLTSATIPTSLNTYLTRTHPSLLRLASPNLHKLPKALQVEYVAWSGGNKFADVLRRLKKVWAEDAAAGFTQGQGQGQRQGHGLLSQVVIFCNRSSKAEELGEWLQDQSGNGGGVRGVVVVTGKGGRGRGNNKHLESFLRNRGKKTAASVCSSSASASASASSELNPKVLITTSLLSRGLDFAPSVKHVFIIDAPRNMVDFLHRAGRAGRAGEKGRVVVFGKMKGRGSRKGKEIRGRVASLV